MARFPSDEWVQEYAKKLNGNQAYREAGKTWEGDIVFVVEKDETFHKNVYIYLDLYHGECRRAQFADSLGQVPKAVYAYKGPYSNWRKLIGGQIDPIQGLLNGKFRLDGSLMEIMKYIRAAREMVITATTVQTEF
jgi:putative sterol carrier protein